MRALRIGWAIASFLAVQILVCGLAAAPVVVAWIGLLRATRAWPDLARTAVLAAGLGPSYLAFALLLMVASVVVLRLVGWRAPVDAVMPVAGVGWPVLTWARAGGSAHLVRLISGSLLRGSPVWTAYLRLSGARLGRRVYVNSLAVSDYNLLEFGDDVVIGADAHISGHTVEAGVVRTGRVRLGRGVIIGVGSVVDIGVVIGDEAQIGALSLVPKHTMLPGGATYVGIPARRLG